MFSSPQLLPNTLHLTSYLPILCFSLFPLRNPHKTKLKTNKKRSVRQKKNKIKQKYIHTHKICFVFANYSWAWSLPWGVVLLIYQHHSIGEN